MKNGWYSFLHFLFVLVSVFSVIGILSVIKFIFIKIFLKN